MADSHIEALKSELATVLSDGTTFFFEFDNEALKQRRDASQLNERRKSDWYFLTDEERESAEQIRKRLSLLLRAYLRKEFSTGYYSPPELA